MTKKYKVSKKKLGRFLIILILIVIALIFVLVRCDHMRREAELQEKKEKAEAALSSDQKASNIAKAVNGKSFNVVAYHKIDLDKALNE